MNYGLYDGLTRPGFIGTNPSMGDAVYRMGPVAGNFTLDPQKASYFTATVIGGTIYPQFISPTIAAFGFTFEMLIGAATTVGWPSNVKWQGGVAPSLTSTTNKVDIFSFSTSDGGQTWYGFIIAQNL